VKNNIDVKMIQDYFYRQPDVKAVFLFGSFAKNKARPASDVDIAVLLGPSIPEDSYLDQRLQFMSDLSGALGREADVVIFNEAGPVLKHQIFEFGRLLYETDHQNTTSFKARSMIEYVDWLPYKMRLDKGTLQHFRRSSHG
jgi:predicted nucleotidyltransferase